MSRPKEEMSVQELQVLNYASKHHQYMWAATIMGIILDCDFKDSFEVYNAWRYENYV